MLKCHRTSFHAPLMDIPQWYTARRQSTEPLHSAQERTRYDREP